MPELPEVETIIRSLRTGGGGQPGLVGMKLLEGEVFWDRSLATPSAAEFKARLPGQMIEDIRRRGKYIVIPLTRDFLLIHLRMSGDLRLIQRDITLYKKHDRVSLALDGGWSLVFNDTRKFGRMWLVRDEFEVLGRLGPEPFDTELTHEVFNQMLAGKKRCRLKSLLLDQHFLAGLGNIYSDEALHRAGLHPLQNAGCVSPDQAGRLLMSIREVLAEGIHNNGASIDWVYRGGGFQNKFKVYQRTGQPCWSCGTLIERILVSQRSTHYCPVCQV